MMKILKYIIKDNILSEKENSLLLSREESIVAFKKMIISNY